MEIVGNPVGDDCMPSIVSSLGSSAELYCRAQNIDQLSFALENEVSNCSIYKMQMKAGKILHICMREYTSNSGGSGPREI